MESSVAPPPPTSRFRFRETENSGDSDASSDVSPASVEQLDDESELESMTGKGIKRLCMELLEIKAASDEDFHQDIFANYSAFVGMFEQVQEMEKELMQLKVQVNTQKGLVKELVDGMYLKLLSEESIDSIIEEDKGDDLAAEVELEAHINDVSEMLDMLITENKIEEAIGILAIEEENLERVQREEDEISSDVVMLCNSVVSEKKAVIKLQLTLLAENSRVSAAELQRALVGVCRLGDSHLAVQLLLKYYHSNLITRINKLQRLKPVLHGIYVRELSKSVFSIISQAARSFIMLCGETSPYTSELIQWIKEEVELFAVEFTKYVNSISEITGGLSTAVEAVHFAMSYCTLLEAQKLVLKPFLTKKIRPCMEEVLQVHIDHFKKVVAIFTANDAWVLGRFLVPGALNENNSFMVVSDENEYCLFTNSGRKFVTLLQAITGDISSLFDLQMEAAILKGLTDLFLDYIAILERAINSESNVPENDGSRIILAETVTQEFSILANLSSLQHFFCSAILSKFRVSGDINPELREKNSVGVQKLELDSWIQLIQEACSHLRAHFYQHLVRRVFFSEGSSKFTIYGDFSQPQKMMPSLAFQVLFMEVRKLHDFVEESVFEAKFLMELMSELTEEIFLWISDHKDIWINKNDDATFKQPHVQNQFVLDVYFLVEITKLREYFPANSTIPASLMKSVFVSSGLDPERDIKDYEWAIEAATEAIQRLMEIEIGSTFDEDTGGTSAVEIPEVLNEDAGETTKDSQNSSKASLPLTDNTVTKNSSETATNFLEAIDTELSQGEQSSDHLQSENPCPGSNAAHSTDISNELDYIEPENVAYDKFHFQESSIPRLLLSAYGRASEAGFPVEFETGAQQTNYEKLKNDTDKNLRLGPISSEAETSTQEGLGEINSLEMIHSNSFEGDEDNNLSLVKHETINEP